jgi:hypothetical protein
MLKHLAEAIDLRLHALQFASYALPQHRDAAGASPRATCQGRLLFIL